MAGNTLQAMQIGLQVVGSNIANANTPGYVREQAVFTPAPVQKIGTLTLGLGVRVAGIFQNLDQFVEGRLRDAGGERASAEVQEGIYRELQNILGELTDSDISTNLSNFFNAIDDISDTPEDEAIRNLAVQIGSTLTTAIQARSQRATSLYQDFSDRVENLANEMNTLTEQVRRLNLQIVNIEGSGTSGEAGALRSQRSEILKRLSEIAGVTISDGAASIVNVSLGGQSLVFDGTARKVEAVQFSEDGLLKSDIRFADDQSRLDVAAGELHGIYEARDTIVGGFLEQLDEFAGALIFEFNKVFSQGQGITGFDQLTSAESVLDVDAALDEAGLNFTPTSGSFTVLVRNTSSDPEVLPTTTPHNVIVSLDGIDEDLTLSGLAEALDAIDGIAASISSSNRLEISAESSDIDFSFQGDTSGLLAALGINTFFTGSTARDIAINQVVAEDETKFAAATDGIGVGGENALNLIALNDNSLSSSTISTFNNMYGRLINDTTQGSIVTTAIADGLRVFEGTLTANALGISGVSLDEEAIDMISLQRTYQASARFISTVSELLDQLVQL